VNLFDVLVVVAAVLAIVGGWRLGLITRALGWIGALLGVTIGVTVIPTLTKWVNPPSDSGVLLLTAGAFILLLSLGQALGVAIGSRLRPEAGEQHLRRIDAVGGSALGVVGVVLILWLLVPLMAETDGAFYDQLCKHGAARKRQFAPAGELASWRRLIKELS
jgi:uncharacterized membrane protein required for colicin V production